MWFYKKHVRNIHFLKENPFTLGIFEGEA